MKWPLTLITLLALSLPACTTTGKPDQQEVAKEDIGRLNCKIVPHSGINLLVRSTREIRCEFKPLNNGPVEYYKGETGIGFGIDIDFDKHADISYLVRARDYKPGTHQLAGKYSGVGGNVTVGLTVGNTAPISKTDHSVSLQPIGGRSSGIGGASGFTYIYLEPDGKPGAPAQSQ